MARSVNAIIAGIEGRHKEVAENLYTDPAIHLLPPVPRRRRVQKKRAEISARLTEQECAILDALCGKCNMSRAAMIVELHRFSTQKKKISKRMDKIDREIARLKAGREANGVER